jgi:hypothetical protein
MRSVLECWARSISPGNAPAAAPAAARYATFFAGGGDQVPLMIEGWVSLGQYMRSISWNLPLGAGSQFASLSAPGDSFWM